MLENMNLVKLLLVERQVPNHMGLSQTALEIHLDGCENESLGMGVSVEQHPENGTVTISFVTSLDCCRVVQGEPLPLTDEMGGLPDGISHPFPCTCEECIEANRSEKPIHIDGDLIADTPQAHRR